MINSIEEIRTVNGIYQVRMNDKDTHKLVVIDNDIFDSQGEQFSEEDIWNIAVLEEDVKMEYIKID